MAKKVMISIPYDFFNDVLEKFKFEEFSSGAGSDEYGVDSEDPETLIAQVIKELQDKIPNLIGIDDRFNDSEEEEDRP